MKKKTTWQEKLADSKDLQRRGLRHDFGAFVLCTV